MFTGAQMVKHLFGGGLAVDEKRFQEALSTIKEKFPHGKMVISPDRLSISVSVCEVDGCVLCMRCGKPMTNRTNMYFRKGQWHKKVRKDNMSNWECSHCSPGIEGQPLMAMYSTAEEVTEKPRLGKPEKTNTEEALEWIGLI